MSRTMRWFYDGSPYSSIVRRDGLFTKLGDFSTGAYIMRLDVLHSNLNQLNERDLCVTHRARAECAARQRVVALSREGGGCRVRGLVSEFH